MVKRKLSSADAPDAPRRRQPQVSCDLCRSKKLKCDRGTPCNNCLVRSLNCSLNTTCSSDSTVEAYPIRKAAVLSQSRDLSVLARLKRIEDALFGNKDPQLKGNAEHEVVGADVSSFLPSATDTELHRRAKSMDLTFTRHHHKLLSHPDSIKYQITGTPSSVATPSALEDISHRRKVPIDLMTREEALCLLHDYFHNPFHLLPIIHEGTVRKLIHKLYDDLDNPSAPPPNPAHAALILGIGATSTSFFHGGSTISHMFTSEEQASSATVLWLQSALDLLDQSQRAASYCLEDVQARVIISYVFYNIEGCSARFRILQSNVVYMAKDIGLHLVDRPKAGRGDDKIAKEIKRRLWWYITSTDWMLGFLGGPSDGTFSIQPRHMKVNHIRNVNDKDLETQDESFEYPPEVPTDMAFLIQRARLAEICRLALDVRAPEAPDEDLVSIEAAIHLDGLFESMLNSLPPFFQPGAKIPDGAPRCLELQRDCLMMAVHSRRARMHRCYLFGDHQDSRARTLRMTCLKSARIVVSVATRMLDPSQNRLGRPESFRSSCLSRRMGVVAGHLFMSCTILALKAGPKPELTGEEELAEASKIHGEVTKACRMLKEAGKRSPIAASMVRDLTGVLRQYSSQPVAEPDSLQNIDEPHAAPLAANSMEAAVAPTPGGLGMEELLFNGNADGLSLDIFNNMASMESWDELFAGLEPYCDVT